MLHEKEKNISLFIKLSLINGIRKINLRIERGKTRDTINGIIGKIILNISLIL
jgi:hypothetical protein